MSWELVIDSIYTSVRPSTQIADGIVVFPTFTEAKRAALKYLRARAWEFRDAASDLQDNRKAFYERMWQREKDETL